MVTAGTSSAAIALAFALGSAMACTSSNDGPPDPGDDDGSVSDGSHDGAPIDGRDAQVDVLTEAGAGFCALLSPKPAFCDDFDTGEITFDGGRWDILTESNGSASLVTEAKSPPYALLAKSFALGAGEGARLHLRASVPGLATHVALSFSVFLPKATFQRGQIGIASLDVADNHFFTLFLRDDDDVSPGPTLEETGPGGTTRHVLAALPTANTWTRVTVELDLAASRAWVSFDATKVLDGPAIQRATGSEATIRIGAAYIDGPADPFEARFDDVVVAF